MTRRLSRRCSWLLLPALALALLIGFNWNRLALAIGISFSDRRPALLNDAESDKPNTAAAFGNRFGKGSAETELLRWLAANHFEIDPQTRRATLKVRGLPCNENITVRWAASTGFIRESSALVSESGCL